MFKIERTECLKCGKPLSRMVSPVSTDWTHRDGELWPRIGCRAATWNPQTGWDDAIPKAWSATPDTAKIETEE